MAVTLVVFTALGSLVLAAPPAKNPQSGSVGLQGEIPSNPPKEGATITVPGNGQNFTATPITVGGICPKGLLIEIYKNNVFSGSTNCDTGSFTLQIDLFDGKNDLVAKVYDSLNQAGPDSSTVSVNFNANKPTPGPRISLTSAYAKRGAVPGSTLTWPIILSGGAGPYAVSVDWGDKSPADLISRPAAGELSIEHVYKNPGFYTVIIKATDANGVDAFLQVVGVGNGSTQQSTQSGASPTATAQPKVVWWPLLVSLVLTIAAFWLGKRQQIEQIQTRLRKGQKPF
ncbi:MAG: Fibronectin type protein [Candidatus Saccharibacteria bacterium]|nr:Fibronectin type protein [Candidatus Saccharibacteria bacterium]